MDPSPCLDYGQLLLFGFFCLVGGGLVGGLVSFMHKPLKKRKSKPKEKTIRYVDVDY